MNPQDTLPMETPAKKWASLIALVVMWVFLIAVVHQNANRANQPQRQPIAPHAMLVYVTQDSQVYTMEAGVALQHIPLLDCPNRAVLLETSEYAPEVSAESPVWLSVLNAYSFTIDQEYFINSSRTGIEIVLENGEQIALKVHCPKGDDETHYLWVFVSEGMVYLADTSNGTSAPLFLHDTTCELTWRNGDTNHSAYVWEMDIPLLTDTTHLPDDSVIAFSFSTRGKASLTQNDYQSVTIRSLAGEVSVFTDCHYDNQPTPRQ